MTVSTTTLRNDYTGNGVTTAFTVGFYFTDNTHLKVLRTQISTGIVTTLALTTDYTVSGAGSPSGGTVTCLTAPTTDQKISILRNVPLTQQIHYTENDPFPSATTESGFDLGVMRDQQLFETLDRALTLNEAASGVDTSLPFPVANYFIGWSSDATALRNVDPTTMASIITYGSTLTEVKSGDGTTTLFTLAADPVGQNNLDVSIGGVAQRPSLDYTVSGVNVTFSTAPISGTNNILFRYRQSTPVGTVADGTITTTKIVDDSITTAKILNANVTTAKIADANVTPAKLSQPPTLGTSVATTSGTSIDFTSIPSWVNRITVLFNGVSTTGSNSYAIQLGSGSVDATSYTSTAINAAGAVTTATTGFHIPSFSSANLNTGIMRLVRMTGNTWVSEHIVSNASQVYHGSGVKSLSGTLDRIRLTTIGGTDTFDAGSINILYE